MNDNKSSGTGDKSATGVTACCARELGRLVECKTETPSCHWHIPFGGGQLCGHDSNRMIAKGELLAGWSPGVPASQ